MTNETKPYTPEEVERRQNIGTTTTLVHWGRVRATAVALSAERAKVARLTEALLALKHRALVSGPCFCFLWPDEEHAAESFLLREGHCTICTAARAVLAEVAS